MDASLAELAAPLDGEAVQLPFVMALVWELGARAVCLGPIRKVERVQDLISCGALMPTLNAPDAVQPVVVALQGDDLRAWWSRHTQALAVTGPCAEPVLVVAFWGAEPVVPRVVSFALANFKGTSAVHSRYLGGTVLDPRRGAWLQAKLLCNQHNQQLLQLVGAGAGQNGANLGPEAVLQDLAGEDEDPAAAGGSRTRKGAGEVWGQS